MSNHSIITVNLDTDREYVQFVNDIYKWLVILLIFQALLVCSETTKENVSKGLFGKMWNDEYLSLVIYILIGFASYYLVFQKLLVFK